MTADTTLRNAYAPIARLRDLGPRYGALAGLILLVFINALLTPRFATASSLWSLLIQVASPLIVAIGMTMVMGAGGIDLSVGSIMAVASTVSVISLPLGTAAAITAGVTAGLLAGAFNGLVVAWLGIAPFVATLATMVAGRGVAQVLSHGGQLVNFSSAPFEWIGRGYMGPVPVEVAICALIFLLVTFAFHATPFGTYVLAIGGNERSARLAGVRIVPIKIAVYAIAGLLAGTAGVIDTARLGTTDAANIGNSMEFHAVAMALVGGTSLSGGNAYLGGTVTGALMMTVITASFTMRGVPYSSALILESVIILAAILLQRPKVQ